MVRKLPLAVQPQRGSATLQVPEDSSSMAAVLDRTAEAPGPFPWTTMAGCNGRLSSARPVQQLQRYTAACVFFVFPVSATTRRKMINGRMDEWLDQEIGL